MRRAWWDTATARKYGFAGLATILLAKRIAYVGHAMPDNDRDHIRW